MRKRSKQRVGSGLVTGALAGQGVWAYAPQSTPMLMAAAVVVGISVGAAVGPRALDFVLALL